MIVSGDPGDVHRVRPIDADTRRSPIDDETSHRHQRLLADLHADQRENIAGCLNDALDDLEFEHAPETHEPYMTIHAFCTPE